jgi:hypothetical protein
MVLFLCLVPNRGARIGHQTYDYFSILTFCKKMNCNFVYHDFICNSAEFNDLLQFYKMHKYNYNDIINNANIKIINLNDIVDGFFQKIDEFNKLEEDICVFGHICGNETLIGQLNKYTTNNDIIQTKLEHRNYFTLNRVDLKIVSEEYIVIHLRCGDIINDKSRYLNVDYFINQYNKLIDNYPETKNCPVFAVTEYNFSKEEYLKQHIPNCIIIKENAQISLCYLIWCKYLIASRSGFSNLAYILGNCKVIKPHDDWNNYYDNLIELK